MLPAAYPLATRAEVLENTLFPDGMSFLEAPMDAEWAVNEQVLERIDDDKLLANLQEERDGRFVEPGRAAAELQLALIPVEAESDSGPQSPTSWISQP
jgi:hypothetical protein